MKHLIKKLSVLYVCTFFIGTVLQGQVGRLAPVKSVRPPQQLPSASRYNLPAKPLFEQPKSFPSSNMSRYERIKDWFAGRWGNTPAQRRMFSTTGQPFFAGQTRQPLFQPMTPTGFGDRRLLNTMTEKELFEKVEVFRSFLQTKPSLKEARLAWIRLSKQIHPDANSNKSAATRASQYANNLYGDYEKMGRAGAQDTSGSYRAKESSGSYQKTHSTEALCGNIIKQMRKILEDLKQKSAEYNMGRATAQEYETLIDTLKDKLLVNLKAFNIAIGSAGSPQVQRDLRASVESISKEIADLAQGYYSEKEFKEAQRKLYEEARSYKQYHPQDFNESIFRRLLKKFIIDIHTQTTNKGKIIYVNIKKGVYFFIIACVAWFGKKVIEYLSGEEADDSFNAAIEIFADSKEVDKRPEAVTFLLYYVLANKISADDTEKIAHIKQLLMDYKLLVASDPDIAKNAKKLFKIMKLKGLFSEQDVWDVLSRTYWRWSRPSEEAISQW